MNFQRNKTKKCAHFGLSRRSQFLEIQWKTRDAFCLSVNIKLTNANSILPFYLSFSFLYCIIEISGTMNHETHSKNVPSHFNWNIRTDLYKCSCSRCYL